LKIKKIFSRIPISIINDILQNEEIWRMELESHYSKLKNGFEIPEIRNQKIYFKFYEEDSKIFNFKITNYVVNLMMWKPFIKFKVQMNKDYIIDCANLNNGTIKKYIDSKIILPFRKSVPNCIMNEEIACIIEELGRISNDFNTIMAMSMNLKDTCDLMNRNQEYNDIIHFQLPNTLQPYEVEQVLAEKTQEAMNILTKENNNLKPILLSKQGIRPKQLCEYEINIGNKPDFEGNTYPKPINTNFLVYGLQTAANYMIDSSGGRKASVLNKKFVSISGYFARKLSLLNSNTMLDDDPNYDCQSKHLVRVDVINKQVLEMLRGRYYKLDLNESSLNLISMDTKDCKDLIGKTIYIRSPITCCSHSHGRGICYKCYGELAYTNSDIHIGAIAGTSISAPLTQNILSAKHLLATKSMELKMNSNFNKFFSLEGNSIMLNTESIDNGKYYLIIKKVDLQVDDEYDDIDFNQSVTCFYIEESNSGKLYKIKEMDNNPMYLSEYTTNLLEGNYDAEIEGYSISIDDIGDEESLFYFQIENFELVKTLNDIMDLVDKSNKFGIDNYHDLLNKFIWLMIEGQLNAQAIHAECIIRNIIRDDVDIQKYPDYTKDNVTYQITYISKALMHNPSVLISLSYQELADQFKRASTYKKEGSSYLDLLYY
jgi:hypothetical protein